MEDDPVRRLVLAVLWCLVLCPALVAQGKLEQVRQEVRGSNEGKSTNDNKTAYCENPDDAETFVGAVMAEVFGGILDGLIVTDTPRPARCGFLPYPYHADYPGYLWPGPSEQPPPAERNLGGGAGRLLIENGNDFTGLNRLGGQLFLDTARGWGVRLDGNWLHERIGCGCHDNSFLGSLLLTYRVFDHERIQFHLGAGCVMLADPRITQAGVNFTASGDLFPVKPVVISGLYDLGVLGDATYMRLRLTAGWMLGAWEIFGGYDYQRFNSSNLRGPLVGIRMWF